MAELKTKPNDGSVTDFLNSNSDEEKVKDGLRLLEIFREVTGEEAKMWGGAIVGFGMFHYKSQRSSQEGDWPLIAFSPRKQSLTLYVNFIFDGSEELLQKLGKHTRSNGGCLYIKKLADVDEEVLKKFLKGSFAEAKKIYNQA